MIQVTYPHLKKHVTKIFSIKIKTKGIEKHKKKIRSTTWKLCTHSAVKRLRLRDLLLQGWAANSKQIKCEENYSLTSLMYLSINSWFFTNHGDVVAIEEDLVQFGYPPPLWRDLTEAQMGN